ASAISTASWHLFGNIGLAQRLEPHACPIASIAVTDGMRPGRIDFQPAPHEASLGRMFANRQLRLALFEAAAAEPLIAWHPRADAGIAVAKWDYRHRAVVTTLTHARPHEGVAWEIFYPAGPFALLPLLNSPEGTHRSALVWTVAERDAAGVLALSDRAFTHE